MNGTDRHWIDEGQSIRWGKVEENCQVLVDDIKAHWSAREDVKV